jgi:hypothetical protein
LRSAIEATSSAGTGSLSTPLTAQRRSPLRQRQVLAEQPLRDEAAEGAADDGRRGLKPGDDPGVVPATSSMPLPAARLGSRRLSSTVSGSPGQPGAAGA